MHARKVDLTKPATWEFSGFSQNGEDGILDVLRDQLSSSNRYFIEIGTSDGIESNSAWLIVVEQYSGLMIESDSVSVGRANRMVVGYSSGAECRNRLITRENALELRSMARFHDPDLLSLDIDGNDYYVAKAILDAGIKPKIFVVEYNSAFGPHQSVTVEYRDELAPAPQDPAGLYYGVSISGWRKFFSSCGYHFVTVERNGVNAFFVDPAFFNPVFLNSVKPLEFAENQLQFREFRTLHDEQFALIVNQRYVPI